MALALPEGYSYSPAQTHSSIVTNWICQCHLDLILRTSRWRTRAPMLTWMVTYLLNDFLARMDLSIFYNGVGMPAKATKG